MLPVLVASLVAATPAPVAGPLSRGQLIEAWRAVQGRSDLQGRFLTCALVPRCAWQDGLRPYLVDVENGYARRGPLPTIPPRRPAAVGTAYVNVANAMVRARASEKAPISSRLTIGTAVQVAGFSGAFARVKGGGFIHRDLLSAEKPAVEALLAAASAQRKNSLDASVMLLWRAFNLDPTRADVLERLIDEALEADRAPLVAEALALAAGRGTWPLDGAGARSIDELRELLYRASFARRVDVIAAQIQSASDTEDMGARGRLAAPELLKQYHELAGDGVLFQVTDALLGSPAEGREWSVNGGEARLAIVQTEQGARVSSFHLEPALCDWEILRGERRAEEPCKELGEPNEQTMPEEPQAPPEEVRAQPGAPTVAFYDYDTNAGVIVKQWNGQVWQALGQPRGKGLHVEYPALLARQTNGHPALLYAVGSRALYFERWNGDTWEEVAGSASGGGLNEIATDKPSRGYQAALAIDRENRPVVALRVFESERLYVLRLEGGRWKNLACPADGYEPSLVIDAGGAPILVFNGESRDQGANVARAVRYAGGQWTELDGSLTRGIPGSGFSQAPNAGIGPDGVPVMTWPVCPRAGMKGARYIRGRWEPFGSGTGTCTGTGKLGMTVDSKNRPVVAFLGPGHGGPFQVRVLRWDDGRWTQLGSIDGRADDASLYPDGDGLLLAWSSLNRIHVLRWDGKTWRPLPDVSGTGRFSPPSVVVR